MAVTIEFNDAKTLKTIRDDSDFRLFEQEFLCSRCDYWMDVDQMARDDVDGPFICLDCMEDEDYV